MGDFLKELKLDKWYGVTLYLGILCCSAPFFKNTEFLNEKHLFGLGLGLLAISISFFIANRYMHQIGMGQLWSWQEIVHTPLTRIILTIGFLLTTLFLSLIVYNLI